MEKRWRVIEKESTLSSAALDSELLGDMEDHVLRRAPRGKGSRELHSAHLREGEE